MKFKEALESFMDFQEAMSSKGNFGYLTSKVKTISFYMGHLNVEDIDRTSGTDFIKKLRERNPNIAAATINKYTDIIKRVLKTECNIKFEFPKLKETKKVIEVVADEVVDKIFNHYKKNMSNKYNLRNYVLFMLLLETGMRISELLNMKLENINFSLKTIHLKITKTKEERYVFFSDKLGSLIHLYTYKYLVDGYLFQNNKGEPMDYHSLEKSIRRLKKRLSINQSISPHKWRHTFATNYIRLGGDTASLQKLLGHNNLSTTEKYLHLNVDILRKRYIEVMGHDV